ncbi:MAG: hypothetical protein EXR93_04390 [Gemmatimonadetes bacterium]|nr:hypothetical protein [Gemmatimonadota bacterium]
MTNIVRAWLVATLAAGALSAQEPAATSDVRGELLARGAPAELANQIQQIAAQAIREGLPVEPLANKALEGWAKHAASDRLVIAVGDLRHRLAAARDAALGAGLSNPASSVVSAAAQALARGMTPDDVRTLIRSAGRTDAAATGLMVASSLAAQGIERGAATHAVGQAFKDGHTPNEVLELPSVAASMMARGMTVAEVTTRMLAGNLLAIDRPELTGRAATTTPVMAAPPHSSDESGTLKPKP